MTTLPSKRQFSWECGKILSFHVIGVFSSGFFSFSQILVLLSTTGTFDPNLKEFVLSGLSVSLTSSGAMNFVSNTFINLSLPSSLSLCTPPNNVNPLVHWGITVSMKIYFSVLIHFSTFYLLTLHNYTTTKGTFIWEKRPGYSQVNHVPPVAGMIFNFRLYEKFLPDLRGWICHLILFWVRFSLILVTVQPSLLSIHHSLLAYQIQFLIT